MKFYLVTVDQYFELEAPTDNCLASEGDKHKACAVEEVGRMRWENGGKGKSHG